VPLPEIIAAKVSSEAAGYITMSRVMLQQMPIGELVERVLGVTGKNAPRIREILLRGTIVSGATRYRWESIKASEQEIEALLSGFPEAQPERPFDASHCTRVVLRGPRGSLEFTIEAASEKRLFKRTSFWDELLSAVETLTVEYRQYSYTEKCDVYETAMPLAVVEDLKAKAALLKYTGLADQLKRFEAERAELYVDR
jgi:hypothetical protein